MNKRLSISLHAAHWAGLSRRNGLIAAMPGSLVLVLITLLLGCALPALAAAGESRPRSALANAPGLEQRVTYSETKIPLGELVAKVAADTGVPLTAARDIADEPVAVVVKEFPARELLEQFADLLDYRWSWRTGVRGRGVGVGKGANDTPAGGANARPSSPIPNPQPAGTPPFDAKAASNGGTPFATPSPVFEIYQNVASKQREEALRQALSAGVEQQFQEKLAICRELAGKSQEEIQRLWDEWPRWHERLQKLTPGERWALEHSPEGEKARRYGLLGSLWSPIQRSLAGWTLRLPPEQWAAMRAGRPLIFSSDPQRGELPLPPAVLHVFRTTQPILAPPRQPEQEEPRRQEEQQRQERWGQAEQYRVTVRFGPDPPAPGHRELWVAARPFGGDGRSLYPAPKWRYEGFYLDVWAAAVIDTAEEDPRRPALPEQDPVLSVKKPFQPDTRPYADPLFFGAPPRDRFLTEFLPALARAYGVNFIADSYWWARKPSGTLAGPAPLFEVLDRLAGQQNAWDRRGNLVRFRDRRWFLDRPGEIPLRLVRHWIAVTDRLGALPLAEFASAAATLTDAQLFLLSYGWLGPPQLADLRSGSPGALEQSRSLLRLYGRLSPTQQRALWEGKPVSIAQLSPALRSLVLAALNRIAHTNEEVLDLEQWEGGYLSFTRQPDVRIRERRGQSVTFRLESEPAPRATTRPDEVTRFPVTHLEMRIQYGAQNSYALRLLVAAEAAP